MPGWPERPLSLPNPPPPPPLSPPLTPVSISTDGPSLLPIPSRPSPAASPPSALALSRHRRTKEGSGLVALWWMHFHRPISVILEKQVSASILSGLYSSLAATHPAHPFLRVFSHLLFPSRCPPPPFSEGHSLILLSINADPVTLSLKAWLSLSHPNPCPSILTHAGLSAEGWVQSPPLQGQGLADIGPQNNRRPFLSTSPWTPPGLSFFGLIGYAGTYPSQSISFI